MDEATPHMHLAFCPINKEGKLSAKKYFREIKRVYLNGKQNIMNICMKDGMN